MKKLDKYDVYPEFCKKDPAPPPSQQLLAMLNHVGPPFCTTQGSRFITIYYGDGCSQTLSIHNPAVRFKAIREYTEAHGHPPHDSDLRTAFRAFQAQAAKLCFDVHHRMGFHSGDIHLDPFWNSGKHIEITPYGWNSRNNRLNTVLPSTTSPLPEVDPNRDTPPDPLAALDPLRNLLRLEADRPAWLRVVVWLLAAFRPPTAPDAPRDYPILQISGPAGCGKTATARMLRALVDPNEAPITFTPASEAAGGRIARDNHVIFIDGVTRLARRPAEILARLSTGLPARFYGEMQNLSRPILITTNEPEAAERIGTRVLPVDLPPLPNPLPQDELRKRFEAIRPQTVAALLTLLSAALRRLPGIPCPETARFPEAIQWANAALETLDQKDLICVTQPQNQFEAKVTALIEKQGGQWQGTATGLVEALNENLTPRALSQKLTAIQSLTVTKSRTGRVRKLTLSLVLPIRVHSCSFVAHFSPFPLSQGVHKRHIIDVGVTSGGSGSPLRKAHAA